MKSKIQAAKRKKNGGFKLRVFFLLCMLAIISFVLIKYVENRVMPIVKRTMEQYAVMTATGVIDNSVKSVIEGLDVKSQDLYIRTTNESGKLTSLSADTVLINSICSDVSGLILERLAALENESMYFPLGILSGFDFLAAKGPKIIEVSVKPMGECVVDYNTSFKSEGINQVNYQIWLDIETSVGVINPLINETVTVARKVPIVNTYINGDVPESMVYPFINPSSYSLQ